MRHRKVLPGGDIRSLLLEFFMFRLPVPRFLIFLNYNRTVGKWVELLTSFSVPSYVSLCLNCALLQHWLPHCCGCIKCFRQQWKQPFLANTHLNKIEEGNRNFDLYNANAKRTFCMSVKYHAELGAENVRLISRGYLDQKQSPCLHCKTHHHL